MTPALRRQFVSRASSVLLTQSIVAAMVMTGLIAGCGGAAKATGGAATASGGAANVTVLATATANDQLANYGVKFDSLTLTNSGGKSVTIFATPRSAEFIHVNGTAEPLASATIPEDVYTSATATAEYAYFECIALTSQGGLFTASYNLENPSIPVTVNLPQPISVNGQAMGLSLDLLVSQSASWPNCAPQSPSAPLQPYSITPTFELAPIEVSPDQANSDGTMKGLHGLVSGVTAGSLAVTNAQGTIWDVGLSSSTQYQGISGPAGLVVGIPVEMDVELQTDGSLRAVRVAVPDTDATDVSVAIGPVETVMAAWPAVFAVENEEQGYLAGTFGSTPFSFGSADFEISGQFTNLQNLPFSPSFNASNMVAGQIVSITTHALGFGPAPTYAPATTMTLLPQTLNGTVSAVGSESGFTTYTITLAPYDLFPDLAVQGGQITLLTDPSTVVVYADANTQMLNTQPIAAGSVARFYGLVFNDNGTLRMDCAQVMDGVPE